MISLQRPSSNGLCGKFVDNFLASFSLYCECGISQFLLDGWVISSCAGPSMPLPLYIRYSYYRWPCSCDIICFRLEDFKQIGFSKKQHIVVSKIYCIYTFKGTFLSPYHLSCLCCYWQLCQYFIGHYQIAKSQNSYIYLALALASSDIFGVLSILFFLFHSTRFKGEIFPCLKILGHELSAYNNLCSALSLADWFVALCSVF